MTKLDIIKTLTDAGVFELTQDILDTINKDSDPDHAKANRNLFDLIISIDRMKNWTAFSWKLMVDLATQAYGFHKFLAYSDMNVCADVEESLDELHSILWAKTSIVVEESDA